MSEADNQRSMWAELGSSNELTFGRRAAVNSLRADAPVFKSVGIT